MGAIDGLMDRAKVPDYMQMHTEGSAFVENKGISMERRSIVQESEIRRFSEMHGEVSEWQICRFLNMDNSQVFLGGKVWQIVHRITGFPCRESGLIIC